MGVALVTTLVGCGTTPIMQKASEVAAAAGGPGIRMVFEQHLPDGRTVLCVYAGYNRSSGGLSCDWEGAR